MKTLCRSTVVIACLLLGVAPFSALATAPQTSYPIFGILGTDPALQGKESAPQGREAFEPIQQYKIIYMHQDAVLEAVRDAKIQYGFDTRVLVYMGGFTTNRGGATLIEQQYRHAVAMIDVATLAAAIDAKATEITASVPADGEFPILASTADVSDPKDSKQFCFWIRVDDELMKVAEADGKTGRLRVVRGFDSQAAAHKEGATILAPCYVGNRDQLDAMRHTNSWPGGPDYMRYALDPASDDAQRFKASYIIEWMKSGYDGAWLDTFEPTIFNICDPLGRKVAMAWDFRNGRRHTMESNVSALQEMVRGVRKKVKEAAGREPYIAANNVAKSYETGGKLLLASRDRPGLLDAYCFEDSYLRPSGGTRAFSPVSKDKWTQNVTNERDAARDGLRALCMIGPAGWVAAYINPSLPNYDQLVRFSWCSFLLTVTKERTTYFGMPLLITNLDGKAGFLPLAPLFFYPIGDPIDDGGIDSFTQADSGVYLRTFTNGLVVVAPPGLETAATVAIPAGYRDPKTQEEVRQLTLNGGDGVLLLKELGK
ncbi:MAG: hypothetical protein NTW86_06275 [Candidatus Sumerlaeota bacterium]|nr:hypothetical protein [Candidatus Sumerlaeota bacterium]